MKPYNMPDKTGTAGGEGFGNLPIRRVMVPHPTFVGLETHAYEIEYEVEPQDKIRLLAGGRVRICLMSRTVIPIHVDVVKK